MAERVGFEPTVRFPAHMISSHADSAGLSHLSDKSNEHRGSKNRNPNSVDNKEVMEQTGFEPVTSSVRGMRSPN